MSLSPSLPHKGPIQSGGKCWRETGLSVSVCVCLASVDTLLSHKLWMPAVVLHQIRRHWCIILRVIYILETQKPPAVSRRVCNPSASAGARVPVPVPV